jgi:Na+-transporting NADH:ubiquinone oxidoreductase subunit NqrC
MNRNRTVQELKAEIKLLNLVDGLASAMLTCDLLEELAHRIGQADYIAFCEELRDDWKANKEVIQ